MATQIFLNLPVKDLERSKAFFVSLGYTVNPQFSDETAASIVVSDTIYLMLLTHAKYETFTKKQIADATKTSQMLVAMSAENRAGVDTLVDAALKAGATIARPPEDHGFMYLRSFDDLDGHTWEVFWMDPAMVQPN